MPVQLDFSQYEQVYTLDRDVIDGAYSLIYYLAFYGGRARVTEGRRSAERQRQLYASGRTQPGPVLTMVRTSLHQSGRAFDIDFVGLHPDNVPLVWWEFSGAVGEALGLRWGGRFRTLRDLRHFEG